LIRNEKPIVLFEKLPCDCEIRGHCMCKEMLAILVNRAVDKKRIIEKMEGRGGGEAQGVADPQKCLPWMDG
jgi:hypothetical protein